MNPDEIYVPPRKPSVLLRAGKFLLYVAIVLLVLAPWFLVLIAAS